MNIIVWTLALLLPIVPALLFFIPGSSTAEASTADDAQKPQPQKEAFWRKWKFKLTGAAAAYLVFAWLALHYRPVYVAYDVFTVWGMVDIDPPGQRPQLNQLRFDLPPPKYSDRDGTFSWKVIKQEDGLPTLSVIWADQKLLGNPDPVHLDPKDPFFDKRITEIAGHTIMVKKHFAMRAPPPLPAYNPSPTATPSTYIRSSALTANNER